MTEAAASHYECPVCHKQTPRDLLVYLDHARNHIIDAITKEHPEWTSSDGTCTICMEYYEKQLSGEYQDTNIGPKEIRKRFQSGVALLVLSAALMIWLLASRQSSPPLALILFLPLWLGFSGIAQARMKTCAMLAELGMKNMGKGNQKILKEDIISRLKSRGRQIMLRNAVLAASITLLISLLL